MINFKLPYWADLHAHFRQGPIVPALLGAHRAMGCNVILAMPNMQPPVRRVLNDGVGADLPYRSIVDYLHELKQAGAASPDDGFDDVIIPLYITRDTTAAMIEEGAKSGMLRAAKYYPPHGTTNSDHGIPMLELLQGDVLQALSDHNIILNIHGEQHGVKGEDWFGEHGNAETVFYQNIMPRLLEECPNLKIVCEHITTKEAAQFVSTAPATVGATITPQHLLYTAGDLLQGWYAHLRCMPLVKFQSDVNALRKAVTDPDNIKFFAGTDSAPHPKHAKAMDCGCAAGCFVGGIAPQLYAQGFEAAGFDFSNPAQQDIFKKFLCSNGPDFYGLPRSTKTFTLIREPSAVVPLPTLAGDIIPLPLGLLPDGPARAASLPWRIEL